MTINYTAKTTALHEATQQELNTLNTAIKAGIDPAAAMPQTLKNVKDDMTDLNKSRARDVLDTFATIAAKPETGTADFWKAYLEDRTYKKYVLSVSKETGLYSIAYAKNPTEVLLSHVCTPAYARFVAGDFVRRIKVFSYSIQSYFLRTREADDVVVVAQTIPADVLQTRRELVKAGETFWEDENGDAAISHTALRKQAESIFAAMVLPESGYSVHAPSPSALPGKALLWCMAQTRNAGGTSVYTLYDPAAIEARLLNYIMEVCKKQAGRVIDRAKRMDNAGNSAPIAPAAPEVSTPAPVPAEKPIKGGKKSAAKA